MTRKFSIFRGRLRRLGDRQELADLIARYGIAVDDRDMNTLGDLFSRSATVQQLAGPFNWADAVIAFYRGRAFFSQFGQPTTTSHHTVDFLSDEEATGVVAAHRRDWPSARRPLWPPFSLHGIVMSGRMDDGSSLNGGWRFLLMS